MHTVILELKANLALRLVRFALGDHKADVRLFDAASCTELGNRVAEIRGVGDESIAHHVRGSSLVVGTFPVDAISVSLPVDADGSPLGHAGANAKTRAAAAARKICLVMRLS